MAELSDVVRDGSVDTFSHDHRTVVVRGDNTATVGTIEVVVLHTGKLGGQDDEALFMILTRDNVAVISTHRP